MAYGTPADPVASTVITVAYAVANILDPIRALRAFTGGSDPPGSGYVVTADSTIATTWKTLLAAITTAFGQGTVAANINTSGTFSTTSTSANSIVTNGGISAAKTIATFENLNATSGQVAAATAAVSGNGSISGTASLGAMATAGNGSVGGTFSVGGAQTNASTMQATQFTSTISSGTPPFVVASNTEVANLNAAALSGFDWLAPKTATQSATRILTTTYQDAASLSVTLDRNGKWLVFAQVDLYRYASGGDGNAFARLLQGASTALGPPGSINSGQDILITVPLVGVATVTGGSDTVKVQGRIGSGSSGASYLDLGYLIAVWISP